MKSSLLNDHIVSRFFVFELDGSPPLNTNRITVLLFFFKLKFLSELTIFLLTFYPNSFLSNDDLIDVLPSNGEMLFL